IGEVPDLDEKFVRGWVRAVLWAETRQGSPIRRQEDAVWLAEELREVLQNAQGKLGLDLGRSHAVDSADLGPELGFAVTIGDQSSAVGGEARMLDRHVGDGP